MNPLGPGGDGIYFPAVFDVTKDTSLTMDSQKIKMGSILIFDGIFLHRPELLKYWDYSIFLDVRFEVSIGRCAQRGDGSPDVNASSNLRYIEGQKIYLAECQPHAKATVVIDYNDFLCPRIVEV